MTAKDYFQDIMPPSEEEGRGKRRAPARVEPEEEPEQESMAQQEEQEAPRGIRSIPAPMRRPRPVPNIRDAAKTRRKGPRFLIWVVAALSLLVVAGLALFALRPTSVTVIPKSHPVIFSETAAFIAYPSGSAATGTLSYTVKTIDLEDSQVVAAQGTTTIPASKASGSITVYNDYSTTPVRLIKNTRFQTPEGLVYRAPAEVVVPGKSGSTPGQIAVTVFADEAGEQYNIGPVSKFTLPGLQTTPAMYSSVYAKSSGSMAGGAAGGVGPAVAPAALTSAVSDLQARLKAKTDQAIAALSTSETVALPGLAQISYQELPRTTEADGGVRIHEGAHVAVPVFMESEFAEAIGMQVSADAGTADLMLVPGSGFGAQLSDSGVSLGASPVEFTLTGQGTLVWVVDASALAEALAGKEANSFQAIVNSFPGVDEAHARIEPFWKSSFPTDPATIKIEIKQPASAK